MNFVENNGKKVAAILCVASCFPVVATIYAMETEPGWHGDVYVENDKTVAKGWTEIEGKSYYFDEDGNLEKDTTKKANAASASTSVKENVKARIAASSANSTTEEEGTVTTPVVATVEESNTVEAEAVAEETTDVVAAVESTVSTVSEVQAEAQATTETQPTTTTTNTETEVASDTTTTQATENASQTTTTSSNESTTTKSNVVDTTTTTSSNTSTTSSNTTTSSSSSTTTTSSSLSDLNSRIVAAAYAAIDTTDGQQCTEVATGVLNEAGVSASVVWPAEYLQYGYEVSASDAVAGNLIYYEDGGNGVAHIGIYVGDGQAVQGNFDGETILYYAEWDGVSGVHYIQVTG